MPLRQTDFILHQVFFWGGKTRMTNAARCWLKEQSDVLQPHKVERAGTAGSLPDEDSDHCRFGGPRWWIFFRIDPVSHQWKCGGIYRLQVASFEVAMTRVAILTWYIQCIYLFFNGYIMYISRYTNILHTSSHAFSIPRIYIYMCIYIKHTYLEKLVYHFFRQLWLVLGVKLLEISSNWFFRYMYIYIYTPACTKGCFLSFWKSSS